MVMIDQSKDIANWASWLSNCLIGLVFEYRTRGESAARANVCSAFVLELRNEWILVTAGHVREIFEHQANGDIEILGVKLLDGFGSQPKTRRGFEFDLDAVQSAFYYDDELGLDVAFVHLRPFYRNLLEANGVRVFTEANWQTSACQSFEAYMLLGLLQESVQDDGNHWQVGSMITVVRECKNPPDCLVKSMNRLYGEIPDSTEYKSIVGMSGGPLLGFRRDGEGKLRYWIVGLQNGWHAKSHSIAVGPIATIQEALSDWIGQLNR
jgi:hypothetical protein